MAATCPRRISAETVKKSVNTLIKWKNSQSKSDSISDESDDFIYLSVTLNRVPSQELTLKPHRIPLQNPLFPNDYSNLNICLMIDGKRITFEAAQKILKSEGLPIKQVLKFSKLKSDYKSFESKKKLYDSFDVFFCVKGLVPLLPKVLGRVFYRKKRKIPIPVDLKGSGGDWKGEIEKAFSSSFLWFNDGTCCAVRVGKWGFMEGDKIVENVFRAIDGVTKIVPKKRGGIKCLHLKFSDSVALPVYQDDEIGEVVGEKRKRTSVI